MRIACITAGAGRMYCGSCLRDNALARALLAAGHDVLLIPTYTPTRTDDTNVSISKVFLGGINIYLKQRFRIFRKAPPILDRLFDLKPVLKMVTRLGMSVDPTELGSLTVCMLQGSSGFLKKEIRKLVRFLKEISPDVINLPNSLLSALAPAIKEEMNVPVCCTLQGEELFIESLREPFRSESLRLIREHTASVDAFMAVSNFGARSMAEYLGIRNDRMHVVPLGMNFDDFECRNTGDSDPFTIGYLARVAPEKGLHHLCDAYRILRSREGLASSRLWAAGYLPPEHTSYLSGILNDMNSSGLSDHFRYHGELDRNGKLNFLGNLNLFSVPGTYDDPKGLFLLEALACGIPVVQPRQGAFTEIVETTGGGILVEPGNPTALAEGFLDLWNDPQRRKALGDQGKRAVREHYNAARMADAAVEVYRSIL